MFLPGELAQIGDWWRRMAASFGWGAAHERAMCARLIVIAGELAELAQKIRTVPEYDVVHLGLSPSPFRMPGSQLRRSRIRSARLAARSPAPSRELG
jgi:hypothetical protein